MRRRIGSRTSCAKLGVSTAWLSFGICPAWLTFRPARRTMDWRAAPARAFSARPREAAKQEPDASIGKPLEDLLNLRDKIAAELAQGDPGVLSDLQALFVKTRLATG